MPVLRRRRLPPHRSGLSLPEVLVVMALLSLILVITTVLFLRGRDAMQLATDRLDTSGRARRTIDALTPFVSSAIRDVQPPLEARDLDPTLLTDPCSLLVTTRERFLAPDYKPSELYVPSTLVPAQRYQILFRPATHDLIVQQLRLTPSGEEIDPDVSPRLLGRDLEGCGFVLRSPGSIQVTLRTRAERNDKRRPGGATSSQLSVLLTAPGVH